MLPYFPWQSKLDDEKRASDEEKRTNSILKQRITKLELELEEYQLKYQKVEETNKYLQDQIILRTEKVEQLEIRSLIWRKAVDDIFQCIAGVTKCREAISKMITFIGDAFSSDKHLDPSLLFPTSVDGMLFKQFNLIFTFLHLSLLLQISLCVMEILTKES